MVKWKRAQGRYAGRYEQQLDKSPGFIQRPTFFSRTVDGDKVGHPTVTEIPILRCTVLLDAYPHVRDRKRPYDYRSEIGCGSGHQDVICGRNITFLGQRPKAPRQARYRTRSGEVTYDLIGTMHAGICHMYLNVSVA